MVFADNDKVYYKKTSRKNYNFVIVRRRQHTSERVQRETWAHHRLEVRGAVDGCHWVLEGVILRRSTVQADTDEKDEASETKGLKRSSRKRGTRRHRPGVGH